MNIFLLYVSLAFSLVLEAGICAPLLFTKGSPGVTLQITMVVSIHFAALTLKGKTSEVWDPEAKGAEDYQGGHKLIIKQALLGPEAAEGEVNVVQVEAMTWKDSVKIPVATLKAGGPNNQVLLDLSFPDPPVTFSLIQGNGPVHIIGHHLIGSPMEEFDEMDELEEEMLDDEEGEEGAEEDEDEDEPKPKKAKPATNAKGKTPVKNNAKAAKK